MKTMWTSRVLILIVFCLSVAILPVANLSALDGAEEPPPRRNLVMLGAGLSFGFFSPADVNTYLEDWLSGFSAYGYEGTSSLLLYLAPRISFIYAPIEYVQFEVLGEMGWGPKIFLFDTGGSGVFLFQPVFRRIQCPGTSSTRPAIQEDPVPGRRHRVRLPDLRGLRRRRAWVTGANWVSGCIWKRPLSTSSPPACIPDRCRDSTRPTALLPWSWITLR